MSVVLWILQELRSYLAVQNHSPFLTQGMLTYQLGQIFLLSMSMQVHK